VLEDGSVVCDTASWVVDGEDQYARTSGNVGIGTTSPQAKLHVNGDVYQTGGKVNIEGNTTMTVLNVTKALYAPGMGAGSVNITFLNATNATIDNLTVRNIYVTDNAAVGMALTATNLNARSGISAPGFVVSTSVTTADSIYAKQLCMKRSGPASAYVCINYWTDLLSVLYAQVG
jgi:hypothetical protein